MRRAFFEATGRTYPHTALSRARWVARSSVGSRVAFLVATPWWPPAAALPVWTFCWAQYLGKAATLVPSRWSFARRLTLDTSLKQYVGRLSHDRTTERHWGSHRATVPKEVPCGSSTPAAAHATSPGQSLCDYHQSLSIVKFDQAGAEDSRWVHSPAPYRVS